jgi:hypothetical protein
MRGGGEAGLGNQLMRSQAENAFDEPREPDSRQPSMTRQRRRRDRFRILCFEVFQRSRQPRGYDVAVARRPQIAGDAHYSDDFAVAITHRAAWLLSTSPERRRMYQCSSKRSMIDCPLRRTAFILPGVTFGQFLRKKVSHVATKHILFLAQTATLDQGLIGCHVAPIMILDKEDNFGNMIEKLFNHE